VQQKEEEEDPGQQNIKKVLTVRILGGFLRSNIVSMEEIRIYEK
jgi:hypothetical protein